MKQAPTYSSPQYWDSVYSSGSFTEEWYIKYSVRPGCMASGSNTATVVITLCVCVLGVRDMQDMSKVVEAVLSKATHALVVGCGMSPLSADMVRAGYKRVTSIDIAAR